MLPSQCRSARELLGLTRADLSERSGVSPRAIQDFELSRRELIAANHAAVSAALEKAGVAFIDDGAASDGGGPGVRLAKRSRKGR